MPSQTVKEGECAVRYFYDSVFIKTIQKGRHIGKIVLLKLLDSTLHSPYQLGCQKCHQ